MNESRPQIERVRAEILVAAEERFRRYGYGKTTMAEIAADAGMSAANLYRYFHNKQAIAAECAGLCMSELSRLLEIVVSQPHLSSTQRLHLFVQTAMRYYYEMMHEVPRLNELIENVMNNFPQLIHEKNSRNEQQIAAILQMGVADGEFEIDDIDAAASAVARATVMFSTPFFMPLFSIEEFEKMAVSVVDLLLTGLTKK